MLRLESILDISNFKCFGKAQPIPFTNLTVLCGRNSMGKSSIIQAMLLHQSALRHVVGGITTVPLNDSPGLALGTQEDVLHRGADDSRGSSIGISLTRDGVIYAVEFSANLAAENSGFLKVSAYPSNIPLGQFDPWSFVYLSAERMGPRINQSILSHKPLEALEIGEHGQFVAEVLHRNERSRVRPELLHPEELAKATGKNSLLLRNVELWLSELFGELQLRTESNGDYLPPMVRMRKAGIYGDWVIQTNCGFGISYSLPIIVAGLLMKPGSTLIVDSPEAHLHPAAQTVMARFLAFVAASGVQVVIESHSDHILDGIRIAVSSKDSDWDLSTCTILNLDQSENGTPEITKIKVLPGGSLDAWPKGFFDQQSINLRTLATQAKIGK